MQCDRQTRISNVLSVSTFRVREEWP